MAHEPRFLVIDGYSKVGRDDLEAGGATTAGKLYEQMLKTCRPGSAVDILYPADPGARLPMGADLAHYDGIAWTGSSLTIYHDDPQVHPQVELARAAFAAQLPSFGSCWAAQIAVVAAGGQCAAHPHGREMGIARKIALSDAGRGHPLYIGKKSVFDAFISHDDEVTHLPPGAVLLASNDHSNVQAVAVTHRGGSFWALQYHPEYDLHELARLVYCRTDKLVSKGFFADRGAAHAYVDRLEALHQDPTRRDIAWMLGIDEDVISPDVRQIEVRNWIERLVLPHMRH
jgi:GMP synthase (glutamine-hydrolysing)